MEEKRLRNCSRFVSEVVEAASRDGRGMYEGVTAGRMIPTDRPTAWGGEEIFSGVTDEIDETAPETLLSNKSSQGFRDLH